MDDKAAKLKAPYRSAAYRIEFRLTEAEMDRARTLAKAAGMSVPKYARKRVTYGKIKRPIVVPEVARECLGEIRRIGNNLNQITREVNRRGFDDGDTAFWDKLASSLQLTRDVCYELIIALAGADSNGSSSDSDDPSF